LWDFCGARQACGWCHEGLIGARQQTAMPRVLNPAISSAAAVHRRCYGVRRRDCGPRASQLKSIKTSSIIVLIVRAES
jgi:hypothetical protein